MPPKVINQIKGFGKSFKSMTLDTVKGFLTDSKNQDLRFKFYIVSFKNLNRYGLIIYLNIHQI